MLRSVCAFAFNIQIKCKIHFFKSRFLNPGGSETESARTNEISRRQFIDATQHTRTAQQWLCTRQLRISNVFN